MDMLRSVILPILSLPLFISFTACSGQKVPNKDEQVRLAVQAAPEQYRDSAKVLGYDRDSDLVTLREGKGPMICLADDPREEGFSVACYQKELEPFMARGRELRRQGKSGKELRRIRGKEVRNGKIDMPERSTLYVLTGDYDEEKNELKDSYLRYVVYTPFATPESTGLPTSPPGPGGPWLMDAGTHKAHIMISPPKK